MRATIGLYIDYACEEIAMADYKKMYAVLCKAVDDVICPLEQISLLRPYTQILRDALLTAEDIYIDTSPYCEETDRPRIVELKTDKPTESGQN